jgi:CRISPR/Cas system-associated protein Csm6
MKKKCRKNELTEVQWIKMIAEVVRDYLVRYPKGHTHVISIAKTLKKLQDSERQFHRGLHDSH